MPDKDLDQLIKSSMDDLVDNLDGPTQHRLHQAREHALGPRKKTWLPLAISTSTVATAVVLTWVLLTAPPNDAVGLLEDVDILAAESDPDFYAELEFITWLEENPSLVNEA